MLSLILPTHCEAAVIEETLSRVVTCLEGQEFELIVVDDGSSDSTPQLVETRARNDARLSLIRKASKSGTAIAIQTGVDSARGDVVGTMNADLQHPPELLTTMLERIEHGCDVVVASRYVDGGNPGMSAFRTLVSRAATCLARMVFPRVRSVRDPLAGYFMFRRSVLDGVSLLPAGNSTRVSIGLKYLLGVLVLGGGGSVCEVPCYMNRRRTGRSKFSPWDVAKYVRYLGFLYVSSGEFRQLGTFVLVGASALAVYSLTLLLLTESLGWVYPVSATAGWCVAFILNFVVNDRLTFRGVGKTRGLGVSRRGFRFLGVKLCGLVLHLAILTALTEIAGLHYLASAAVAVMLVVVWNYAASVSLVWSGARTQRVGSGAWQSQGRTDA